MGLIGPLWQPVIRRGIFRVSGRIVHPRSLLTLAIESSCDDTSVAILEGRDITGGLPSASRNAVLHYHKRITSDNREYRGIHPIVSVESHGEKLANLVNAALRYLPRLNDEKNPLGGLAVPGNGGISWKKKPDFVSVTRGPGMRANLSIGLDTAKGLAVAWQIPLVGVHHMQAHALTPRLDDALQRSLHSTRSPDFPFLTLLISGGHTMLLNSKSLTDHSLIASSDVAIGHALDKAARRILPPEVMARSTDTAYGRVLEKYAFPNDAESYDYSPPKRREDEIHSVSFLGHKFLPPYVDTRLVKFSFAAIDSTVEKAFAQPARGEVTGEDRVQLARKLLRVSFEHLASRIAIALSDIQGLQNVHTLVISGGVASNNFLKVVLRRFLDIRGFSHVNLVYPPPSLCTDNAAMIAWAGLEMFEAGYTTDLSCIPLKKWSMDSSAEDGGILGARSWARK